MNIPMTDLKLQYASILPEIDAAIARVIKEAHFILGQEVELLEAEVARYCGVRFAIGVASGTDALALSLLASGVKAGDEVITTPFSFVATVEAICRCGARPVFCDIDEASFNLDLQKIESKISERTKVILPVHLYGLPCPMDEISSIAKKRGLLVAEDCAQSFGAESGGRKTGAIGDCGALSFFPSKILGCYGDGGMIVTDSEELAARARMLRNHGSGDKYHYTLRGFNSRLDAIQAAILRVKLKYVDIWIKQRIENAKAYNEALSGLKAIALPAVNSPIRRHVFNYYTIRVKNALRDKLQQRLEENGISCAVYYPLCLHLQEVYKEFGYKAGDFPVAEKTQEEVLSLPMYPELTKDQIQAISSLISNFFSQ